MPTTRASTKKTTAAKATKAAAPRMTLAQALSALEKAGSAQTRKTYARHGAIGPMFGVSFATLKELTKRIGVDHELALALWQTGNLDARNLAVKIVDPARMASADLDRWAKESIASRTCGSYVGMVAAEGPHARRKAERWLEARAENVRCAGWSLVAHLAQRDDAAPDTFFEPLLARIERGIHAAPNCERGNMNLALIAIGCRGAALRKAATAAAKRVGRVEIDHGDTACKTPDAAATIEKAWAYATSKGSPSPAALERTRETPRRRC
ncbi:MAG: DNA alkylation repair protein [Planctomycetes bacterium]|nr:DNA alkylation repair protein [Planctomycetota bacterium]